MDDNRTGEHATQDAAPDSQPSPPDLEGPLPLGIRNLAPARDDVVETRPDHSTRHTPHGDAEDEIPVTAAACPASAGEPDRAEDPQQEHDPVRVQRDTPDVNLPARGARDRSEQAHASSVKELAGGLR